MCLGLPSSRTRETRAVREGSAVACCCVQGVRHFWLAGCGKEDVWEAGTKTLQQGSHARVRFRSLEVFWAGTKASRSNGRGAGVICLGAGSARVSRLRKPIPPTIHLIERCYGKGNERYCIMIYVSGFSAGKT